MMNVTRVCNVRFDTRYDKVRIYKLHEDEHGKDDRKGSYEEMNKVQYEGNKRSVKVIIDEMELYQPYKGMVHGAMGIGECPVKDKFARTLNLFRMVTTSSNVRRCELFDNMTYEILEVWDTKVDRFVKIGNNIHRKRLFRKALVKDTLTEFTALEGYAKYVKVTATPKFQFSQYMEMLLEPWNLIVDALERHRGSEGMLTCTCLPRVVALSVIGCSKVDLSSILLMCFKSKISEENYPLSGIQFGLTTLTAKNYPGAEVLSWEKIIKAYIFLAR